MCHRTAYPYGRRQIAADCEEPVVDRRRFVERLANRERVGEVGERLGMLRLRGKHFAVARFGALRVPALRVAARFEREPKIVEHAEMTRGSLERALEISDRRVVLAALSQPVAEVKQCLGVTRIERDHLLPSGFRDGVLAASKAFFGLPQQSVDRLDRRGSGCVSGRRRYWSCNRCRCDVPERAMTVLVASAAAARARRIACDRRRAQGSISRCAWRRSHAASSDSSRARLKRAMSNSAWVARLAASRAR